MACNFECNSTWGTLQTTAIVLIDVVHTALDKIVLLCLCKLVYCIYYIACSQGGKSGAMQSCRPCRGSGVKVTMRQIGPGMVQQMQSVCSDCAGAGSKYFITHLDIILLE